MWKDGQWRSSSLIFVLTWDKTSPISINFSTYPHTNANPSECSMFIPVLMASVEPDIPLVFESLSTAWSASLNSPATGSSSGNFALSEDRAAGWAYDYLVSSWMIPIPGVMVNIWNDCVWNNNSHLSFENEMRPSIWFNSDGNKLIGIRI